MDINRLKELSGVQPQVNEEEASIDGVLNHLNAALNMIEDSGQFAQGADEQTFIQAHEQLSAMIDALGQLM